MTLPTLSLPFLPRLRAARTGFVLLYGNEGAILARYAAGALDSWRVFGNVGEDTIAAVRAEIASQPSWPVLVLNDVAEQAYRRETVPRINIIERRRLLRQRLEYAFPGSELKAAAPLPGAVTPRGEEDEYLLASLSPSVEAQSWRTALETLANPIDVALLPVECAAMVARLAETGAGIRQGWTLFISRHRTGGLRQIVIRDGALLLTRMTPTGGDLTPQDLAAEIRSDLDTTLAYLTRFGFTAARGLNLIVIGPEALEEALRSTDLPVDRLDVFDAAAAGAALGLANVVMPDPLDGDLLALAFAAARPKPVLSLLPADLRARRRSLGRRQTAVLAPAVIALALMAGVGAAGWEIGTLRTEANRLEADQLTLRGRATQLRQELAALPLSPDDIARGHALIDQLDRAPDPLTIAARIRARLEGRAPIIRVEWQGPPSPSADAPAGSTPPASRLLVTLDMSAAPDPDAASALLLRLRDRLRVDWPSAEIIDDPVSTRHDESFSGVSAEGKPTEWQRRRHPAVIGVTLDPPRPADAEATP